MAPMTKFLPLVETSCGVSLRQVNSVRRARRKTCCLEVLPDNSQAWYLNKPGLGWTQNLLGSSWTRRSSLCGRHSGRSTERLIKSGYHDWWGQSGAMTRNVFQTVSPAVTPPEGWESEGRGTEREECPNPCSGRRVEGLRVRVRADIAWEAEADDVPAVGPLPSAEACCLW